jgi:hypothetical protein
MAAELILLSLRRSEFIALHRASQRGDEAATEALCHLGDLQKPGGFSGFVIRCARSVLGGGDARSGGVFDVDERLRQIWAKGDSLERLNAVIDFELFRADLERAVPRADRIKGVGRLLITC